jgi:hypothetical protein
MTIKQTKMEPIFTVNESMTKRYDRTFSFIQKHLPKERRVLDLGITNPFSDLLREKGYEVFNTHGEDLDIQPEVVKEFQGIEFVTALEICEHLINPMGVLSQLPCDKLIASIPLSLWFAKAYRSKTDPWDRHFHEFEDWQFDWLLEKSGWEVKASEKWTSPTGQIGIRPFLRKFTPRYYIVYAERSHKL